MTQFQIEVLALAKAMYQGIKKSAPIKGAYVEESVGDHEASGHPSRHGKRFFACALGAAWINGYSIQRVKYGISHAAVWFDELVERFPVVGMEEAEPSIGAIGRRLGDYIIHLNDSQAIPRPSIVAWLKRLALLPEPPKRWIDVK